MEKAVTKPYEPTPQERAAMEAYLAHRREEPPAPRMKVSEKGGVPQLSPDHTGCPEGRTTKGARQMKSTEHLALRELQRGPCRHHGEAKIGLK